jgi:hypothetical protein
MKRNDGGTSTADARETERKPPVWSRKVFANGATLEVAIFEREIDGRNGSFVAYNVTLKRQYKDGDEYKTTSSFRSDDLPHLALLSSLAYAWVSEQDTRR